MSSIPASLDIASYVKLPLQQAFAGSGHFYPLNEGQKLSDDYSWVFRSNLFGGSANSLFASFDKLWNLAYELRTGLGTAVSPRVIESVGSWAMTRDQVIEFHQMMKAIKMPASSSTFEPLQLHILKAHDKLVRIASDVATQIAEIEASCKELSTKTHEIIAISGEFRKKWKESAILSSQSTFMKVTVSAGAFLQLNGLSTFCDMCDNVTDSCNLAGSRLRELSKHLVEGLIPLLQELESLLLDIYCNMLAGATPEVLENCSMVEALSLRLEKWLINGPNWASGADYTKNKKVRRGRMYYHDNGTHRIEYGEDPSSIVVNNENDIQVGISRFDFGRFERLCVARLKLVAGKAAQVWKKRNGDGIMYDTALTWLEIPPSLKNRFRFGKTWVNVIQKPNNRWEWQLEVNGTGDFQKLTPGDFEKQYDYYGNRPHSTSWRVDLDPSTFPTQGPIRVHLWLQDLDLGNNDNNDNYANISMKAWATECTTSGFRINITCDHRTAFFYHVTVAYAIEIPSNTPLNDFHHSQYSLDVPKSNQPYTSTSLPRQDHDFTPVYLPFPDGKFKRTPSVAPFISSFAVKRNNGYRTEVRYAVSRDGILITAAAWDDTVLQHVGCEIFAIADE